MKLTDWQKTGRSRERRHATSLNRRRWTKHRGYTTEVFQFLTFHNALVREALALVNWFKIFYSFVTCCMSRLLLHYSELLIQCPSFGIRRESVRVLL